MVGAGPAGLAAALHLQVRGCKECSACLPPLAACLSTPAACFLRACRPCCTHAEACSMPNTSACFPCGPMPPQAHLQGSEVRAMVHAQRCGVEAVVLEAQPRVGGRVHTAHGGPLSTPVDLGASIITGISADASKGLRADPSAIVARSALPP